MTDPRDATATETARYDETLASLYDAAAVAPEGVDPERFAIERDRRILDVSRIVAAKWPRTAYLMRAWHGDAFIFDVAGRIPALRHVATTLADAVQLATRSSIEELGPTAAMALLRFEDARAGRGNVARAPSERERSTLAALDVRDPRVLDVDFDLLGFITSLDFLAARASPDALVRAQRPTGSATVLAIYARGDRVVAAEIPDGA